MEYFAKLGNQIPIQQHQIRDRELELWQFLGNLIKQKPDFSREIWFLLSIETEPDADGETRTPKD
jgi:adenylosuccinate lyase